MIIIRLFVQPYRNVDGIGGFSFLEKYDSWQAAVLPRRESKQRRIHCWESALCIEQRSEHILDQPFCLPRLWLSMSYVCLFLLTFDNLYYFVAILRNF